MQKALLILVLSLFSPITAAVSLATTDWSCSLSESTVSNAGEYYSSELEPGVTSGLSCNSSNLSISSVATSLTEWTLTVGLQNAVSDLTVEIKRTGTGSGDSVPDGGTSYMSLSTAKQTFFTGTGDVSSIPLSFRVSDFDVADGISLNSGNPIQFSYEITTNP